MKTYYYSLALALSLTLMGCSHSETNTDNKDNQLLFVTDINEEEEDEVTLVSSPDGRICLYSRNNQSRDASWGWSIIYDVKDDGSVYTYEGLPDWEGEPATVSHIYSLPHPRRHLYLFDAFCRISGSCGYQFFITYLLLPSAAVGQLLPERQILALYVGSGVFASYHRHGLQSASV